MTKKKSGQVVGFIITPEEIANRVSAMDDAISLLDGDVRASTAPKLDAAWREGFDAFVRRWAVQRDTFASWGSRLFATRVMPILDDFEASYRAWAKQYQKRSGTAPRVADPAPVTGMTESIVPTELWYLLAAGVALYIFTNRR
jgi:hypothetical protein